MKEGCKITLQELKTSIEQRSVGSDMVIFVCEDVTFLPFQYIREIAKIKGMPINYLESIDTLVSSFADIFGMSDVEDGIRVYQTSEIETLNDKLKYEKDLYIIVNKIKDKKTLLDFENNIVNVPKLEGWQLQDYLYSVAEGIDHKDLDWLLGACGGDIYRIENELDKFRLFNETERKYLFNDMLLEGAYHDLSQFNVFNITNAVTSRDYNMLRNALKEIKSFDAEPLGVVTLLYQGFKKLIQVWLAKNPTTENTGLPSKMIWAINKQQRTFDKNQLIKSFLLLTSIDKELKSGNIDTKWLIDYLICRILTY